MRLMEADEALLSCGPAATCERCRSGRQIRDHTRPGGQTQEKRFDCVVYTRQTSSPPPLRERSVSSFPEVPHASSVLSFLHT